MPVCVIIEFTFGPFPDAAWLLQRNRKMKYRSGSVEAVIDKTNAAQRPSDVELSCKNAFICKKTYYFPTWRL